MNAITTTTDKPIILRSERSKKYARKSRSPRTLKLYGDAWREFEHFAAEHDEPSLPASPATVIDYLIALAEGGESGKPQKVSTIEIKKAAIVYRHRIARLPDPTAYEEVKAVMSGIRRELGTAHTKKAPTLLDDIRKMVATLPDTTQGRRDRALLLVGFFGAFRRSELVALDVADVRINGVMQITVRRSKTDQEGKGQIKSFDRLADKSICPVAALADWLDAASIQSGPIFRRADRWGHVHERMTSQSVALVVKAMAKRAGLDWRQFSGHSLRAGFVTQGVLNDASLLEIAEQTGHLSMDTLRGYARLAGRGALSAMRMVAGVVE